MWYTLFCHSTRATSYGGVAEVLLQSWYHNLNEQKNEISPQLHNDAKLIRGNGSHVAGCSIIENLT